MKHVTFSDIWRVIKQTFTEFLEDKAPRLGAALAYYTIFSIAPLLVIVIGIVGWVFGRDAASKNISAQMAQLVGPRGGEAIEQLVKAAASQPKQGLVATIVGVVMLLVGAAGVFGQLQDALNTIWGVAPKPGRGVWGFIQDRFLSFAMVGGVAFLLLVSLVVNTALAGLSHMFGSSVPFWHYVLSVLNFVVSIGVITLLFAMMYKLLPDVKMAWRDVWVGAFVTAVLFTVGKTLIGMYLGRASTSSAYGAAGSLVVLILWVYYSSQIFLIGAEFTQVYANELGSRFVPTPNAVELTDAERARQGMPTDAALAAAAGQGRGDAGENGAWHPVPQETAASSGRVLPALLGLVAGWFLGRMGRGPKRATGAHGRSRVVGAGKAVYGVFKGSRKPRPSLWQAWRHGWHKGVAEAKH